MFERMMQDMLAKMLPPEVMAMLTPENMKALGDNIATYIVNTRESLARIEEQNATIMKALNIAPVVAEIPLLKAVGND